MAVWGERRRVSASKFCSAVLTTLPSRNTPLTERFRKTIFLRKGHSGGFRVRGPKTAFLVWSRLEQPHSVAWNLSRLDHGISVGVCSEVLTRAVDNCLGEVFASHSCLSLPPAAFLY